MAGLYQENFVRALQTGLKSILGQWGLPPDTEIRLLCVSENATFLATDPSFDSKLVYRVYRPGYNSLDEIYSELNWIDSIQETQIISTPAIVRTQSGSLLSQFEHDGETRHVVAFGYIEGEEADESDDLVAGFNELGIITAKLHNHAKQWRKPNNFTRKVWNFETTLGNAPHWGDWRDALVFHKEGRILLQTCSDKLARKLRIYGINDGNFGLIHADLRLANLLITENHITAIDFDDCGFGWYMYDFAAAISFIETSPNVPELQEAWLAGYQSINKLDQADIEILPTLIMLRRMLLTAWIAGHRETPTAIELGPGYTDQTLELAEIFLRNY